MKNICTSPVSLRKRNDVKIGKTERPVHPSEKTLAFLKLFARNYQVEKRLPEGLQELILG